MNQLLHIWNSLNLAQRVSLAVVPLLICAAGFGITRWKHESDFRPLYNSLAPADASALAQKLREGGIEYRLDETGSTVLVPSSHVAEARLVLAGAGLPRTGSIGFELFDRTSVGASDFTEQVNYRRALEGELERTVATLSEIEQARIHITIARDSVFLDSREPAKATVVLSLKRAGPLQQSSVTAIANLVASAVDGLAPQAVSIIDSDGRLLNRPQGMTGEGGSMADGNLDYRHQVESDMTARINSALEPLLGSGRFRAGVSVDCDLTSSEESEESFDGGKGAILQSQTTEESNASGPSGGQPGTASNLSAAPAKQAPGSSGFTRRTENVSYQPSRTVRKIISPRGGIRRISTAVLVDQTVKWEGSGNTARKTLVPPSPEVLKGVRDVIAGITGYSEQRGDQITVETLPFENTLTAERFEPPPPSAKRPAFDFRQPAVIYGGAVTLLLVSVVFFLLMKRPAQGMNRGAEEATPAALPSSASSPTTVTEQAASRLPRAHGLPDESAGLQGEAPSRLSLTGNSKAAETVVRHIRDAVQKDPVSVARILRTWVSEPETKRSA